MNKKTSWNEYYLSIAFVIAQRSIDPSTKCGCVLVSKDNRILSTGYNGPIKGSDDSLIPLTRPKKYLHFIHCEINALLAYGGSYADIQNSKCYVTIRPCHDCLRSLIQKGVSEIYYSDLPNAACVDADSLEAQKIMLSNRDVKMETISFKNVTNLLDFTKEYVLLKSIKT